ncbi:HTH domain-containing protein [Paenibacillus sp. AN1007]|uniref:HTH domain-containing protein n=1 Tax=Paenibacillus sp. AN1007 TaxID=3151385 RepID=A0AAU8NHK0_9BACL
MPEGSYPFPMYSGLLEPEHYKRIGSAIWLFLWCVSSTTSEKEKEGTVWGIVLGNKPIRMSDLAEQFDVSERTIRDWIKKLEDQGYIRVTRAPYGLIFTVRNSKKYQNRSEEKFQSGEGDRKKSSALEDGDRKKSSDLPEENFRSNKDITKILIDRWIDSLPEIDAEELRSRTGVLSAAVGSFSTGQIVLDKPTTETRALETENYFLQRKGALNPSASDWEHVHQVANEPIPLEFVRFGIDLAIARHKKTRRRVTDKIRTFAYCKTVIFDCWDQLTSAMDSFQTPPVTPGTVAPKPSKTLPFRSRQQEKHEQLSELDRFIEEEKQRGQS